MRMHNTEHNWKFAGDCLRCCTWAAGVEWIQVTQDTDRWRAVLSTVMKVQVVAMRS
jgi:hypothetical protein